MMVLAAVVAMPVLVVVVAPLALLGVVPSDLETSGAWPWPRTDAWALAAGLLPAALTGLAYAFALSLVERWRGAGWRVRPWVVVAPFVVFGLGPVWHPQISPLLSLLTFVVVRQWGVRKERTAPWPRAVRIAALVATVALALVTLSYQPLHPFTAQAGTKVPDGDRLPTSADFELRVEGIAGAQLLSATATEPGLEGAYVVRFDARDVLGRELSAGDVVSGRVALAPAFCHRASARMLPDELVLRVRTLGLTRTQRLPVDGMQPIRCAGGR